MGIFDFVKSVGKKLASAARRRSFRDRSQEGTPTATKLGTDKVEVEVKGDTAVIKGEVADQAASRRPSSPSATRWAFQGRRRRRAGRGAPAKAPVFYEVKKGDNLWKIAEKHYGKGKGAKHTVIFEANKPMLTHPERSIRARSCASRNITETA